MDETAPMVILATVMILAGVAVLWMAMQNRRQIREMEHRERLALIERGLVPAPEIDPGQFERQTGVGQSPSNASAGRFRTLGVIMIGCGLALVLMIGIAGQSPHVGIGIGGAFAVLGAAFLFNGVIMARSQPLAARPGMPHVPTRPHPPADRQQDRMPEP